MAISMVAARLGGIIGNIVIAALLDLYCPLPTYIVAVLLIGMLQFYIPYNLFIITFLIEILLFSLGGGLLCLRLPNTTREPLT